MRAITLLAATLTFIAIATLAQDSIARAQEETRSDPLAEIYGSVELIPGVRAASCQMTAELLIEGTSYGRTVNCDANGQFSFRVMMQSGGRWQWDLVAVVIVPKTNEKLIKTGIQVHGLGGLTTDVAPIVMTRPLTIGGHVYGIDANNCGDFYVTIPSLGLSAALSPKGTFVLNGLPPGRHRLELHRFSNEPIPPGTIRTAIDVDVRTGVMQFFEGLGDRANPVNMPGRPGRPIERPRSAPGGGQ